MGTRTSIGLLIRRATYLVRMISDWYLWNATSSLFALKGLGVGGSPPRGGVANEKQVPGGRAGSPPPPGGGAGGRDNYQYIHGVPSRVISRAPRLQLFAGVGVGWDRGSFDWYVIIKTSRHKKTASICVTHWCRIIIVDIYDCRPITYLSISIWYIY
jgi:hypothetical protein